MQEAQALAYLRKRFGHTTATNLGLRLAVHSQQCGEEVESMLTCYASLNMPPPKRVLRLNYDYGIEACFLAEHFPGAEVIGIESDPIGFACANELAAELKLQNVRFYLHTNLESVPNALKNQSFDLVVAHHVTSDNVIPPPTRCIEEATAVAAYPNLPRFAQHLASLLADDGTLISVEPMPVPLDFARWTWALRDAGIHVNRSKTAMVTIYVPAIDEVMRTPFFAGSKHAAEPLSPDEIRGFWEAESEEYAPEARHGGALAEAIFVSINPKELVHGFRYHFLHSPMPYCEEIWQAGSELVRYVYANGGMAIRTCPVAELPTVIEELRAAGQDKTLIKSFEEYGPTTDDTKASPGTV
jgi:predicted O-methyltransferase YrrM